MAMTTHTGGSADAGKLILRLALGILVLMHGIAKITGGPGFILGLVEKAGLPGPLGYLVYVGEVLAPILLILGFWTRLAALVIAGNMIVALALVHMDHLFMINKDGGWQLELQGMFLFTALALVLLGGGRFGIGGARGRFN
jgi:putative oxidoreductase